jgi:hypothetical protein
MSYIGTFTCTRADVDVGVIDKTLEPLPSLTPHVTSSGIEYLAGTCNPFVHSHA